MSITLQVKKLLANFLFKSTKDVYLLEVGLSEHSRVIYFLQCLTHIMLLVSLYTP